jgi:flagellar biogenesis protein FliO
MAEDRPEEFDRLYRRERAEDTDDFERRRFANVVVLLAVLALILIGYWVFNALYQRS